MTLDEFRKGQDWSVGELARRLGLHDARSAQRYLAGERIPRPEIMRRIAEVTDGQVGPADFYNVTPGSPPHPDAAL